MRGHRVPRIGAMLRLTMWNSQLPAPDLECAALTKTTISFSGPCHYLSGDHLNYRGSRIGRFETCAGPPDAIFPAMHHPSGLLTDLAHLGQMQDRATHVPVSRPVVFTRSRSGTRGVPNLQQRRKNDEV